MRNYDMAQSHGKTRAIAVIMMEKAMAKDEEESGENKNVRETCEI